MSRALAVGFSQRVQLDWLERVASLQLTGVEPRAIAEALRDELRDRLSTAGNAKGSNREKTITILQKVWVRVPPSLAAFRDEGLEYFATSPRDQHFVLHWGMIIAAYPFAGVVAGTVGRLASLQGFVSAAQAQRRLREQLGERETVARAARRVLRSFVDWGVLTESGRAGIYERATPHAIDDRRLAVWLVEGAMRSAGVSSLALASAGGLPVLFPFSLPQLTAADIGRNPRVDLFRQGLDADVMLLRTTPTTPVRRSSRQT